jgi:hypothetical protein
MLTLFVDRLATEEESSAGVISPEVLNRTPEELRTRARGQLASARKEAASSTPAWRPACSTLVSTPSGI